MLLWQTSESPKDKTVVVVTGGTRGLGYQLTHHLLCGGFAVALCGRDSTLVQHTVTQHEGLGALIGMAGDIGLLQFQQDFLQRTEAWSKNLHILVNNASSLGDLPLPNLRHLTPENLRQVMDTNVVAPLLLLQSALPLLDRSEGMSIGISSDAALGAYPGWIAYGASKAALDLAYATVANEEPHLRLYTVDPGDMDTQMHHDAIPNDPGPLRHPGAVAEALLPIFETFRRGETLYASGSRLHLVNSPKGLTLEVSGHEHE